MKRVVTASVVAVVLFMGKTARPQRVNALHAAGPLPQFEVATLKQQDPRHPQSFVYLAPGHQGLVHRHDTAWSLVLQAYGLQGERVLGAPEWARKTEYFVEGKTPSAIFAKMHAMSPEASADQERLMLQALLKERMKLVVHFETREVDAYDLVLAGKEPPKFPKAKESKGFDGVGIGLSKDEVRIQGANASMEGLVSLLGPLTMRFVNDKTGVPGRFIINMSVSPVGTVYAAVNDEEQAVTAPTIFSALRDVELKLVPSKAEVEVVVIDHIEEPTEN